MKPLGVDHVASNVDDVVASVTLDTEMLGLLERTDRPDPAMTGAWLDAGGRQVHLLEARMSPNLGQRLSLQVSDMDDVVEEIRSHGVAVSDPSGLPASARPSSSTRPATPSSCTRGAAMGPDAPSSERGAAQ